MKIIIKSMTKTSYDKNTGSYIRHYYSGYKYSNDTLIELRVETKDREDPYNIGDIIKIKVEKQ